MAEKDILLLKEDLPAIARKLNETVETVQRHAAFNIFGRIVESNPVDTGYSRSNWNVSLDTPNLTVSPPPTKETGRNAYAAPNFPENLTTDGTRPIYISNGVDYVQYLEEGSSQQAPSGFIRIAFERVEAEMEAIIQGSIAP
jgi:hypothetical protein